MVEDHKVMLLGKNGKIYLSKSWDIFLLSKIQLYAENEIISITLIPSTAWSWVLGLLVVIIWSELSCLIAPAVTTTFIILSSNKIQNGGILVLAYLCWPGKWP